MSVNVYENGQLKSIAGSGSSVEVIDNLNSTDIDKALSANQGRILNENKIDINLENIDDSGIERIKEIAGGGVPENIVLHSPSEEEVEVPIIDADKLGGELPEHYENELYLANEITPSAPVPREADTLGGHESSYYAKASDVDELTQKVNEYPFDGAGCHNSIYRGKYLGSSVTAEQYAAIADNTFKDLFIGDYWTIGKVNYRIAGFNYYLNTGDTKCTTPHVVIVPDTCLDHRSMNNTDTTEGAYVGSRLYIEILANSKKIIKTAFGDHVLNHRIYLNNAVANGRPSAGGWYDSEVDLMNEQMVYGTCIFSPVSDGTNVPFNPRVEKSQLPLFAHEHSRIANLATWWLRDVITATNFACISGAGVAHHQVARGFFGVRPCFCIKG